MQLKAKLRQALSLVLAAATMLSLAVTSAMAAEPGESLGNGSSYVTIAKGTNYHFLYKSTGGTIGGSAWTYTSNDGITGPAYCVNWGLDMVSPSKRLQITGKYDRNPQTMGAFANGYPQQSLALFKELHPDIRGIENLTEAEYAYATQIAVWATCGQLAVEDTAFTSGRATLVKPTSDAQQIRVYESVVAILKWANGWTKPLYTGLYFHMEKDRLGSSLEIIDPNGLAGAAAQGSQGLKREAINGTDYYTRTMYVDSATSTYMSDYKIMLYSTDAPAGTIFTDTNNQILPSHEQWGAVMYELPAGDTEKTNLNANGVAYGGGFKLCIPCDNVTESGSLTLNAYSTVMQYNLYLAHNPTATEQSYIIADPSSIGLFAEGSFRWDKSEEDPVNAALQVRKVDGSSMGLEGAEFTLTGSGGTVRTGISDENGYIEWRDLPADETYVLAETKAPDGFTLVAPRNITLTAGQTAFVTIQDDTEKHFYIKKIDAQNGSTLEGAVFRFEQIDGDYVTTATTGFDGMLDFAGDELPYGSFRVWEERAPTGYEKDTSIETVDWDGTRDIFLTFENVRQPTIVVSKVDGITGISLPGATFNVYKDGELIDTVTTNDSGEFRFPIVAGEGYFEFEETVAPEGYQLDRTRHGIYVDPYDPKTEDDPTLTIKNFNNPSLRIIKYDQASGDRLPGITFEIYHDGELYDTLTTDDQGEINLYNIPAGTWLVQEVSTDDEHVVNSTPQQIELKEGQQETQTLVFFNQLRPGIHLVKVDSKAMRSIPNVRFEFKLVGGSYRQEFVTDENGEIDLSKLEPGAYEVRELEAPEGFLVDDGVRVVQIDPDENANFVFTNTPKPALKIVKVSSDGTPLAGVHFRIARIEDGTSYLDRITDENGEINISGLEPGIYSVKETATVSDHVLDTREFHVELFPGETSTLTIENQKRPNLIIYKTDADTGDPVPNTVFLVEAADGHSVDEVKTDAEGKAVLTDLLPGVYEISEKSVPSPYLLDAEPQLVTLYANREHTVYFENHKKPTLTIKKVDSITGSPIEGAKFQVWYGSNSTDTGELNDLGVHFTDASGQIVLDLLQDGWYKVTELEPAPGFTIKEPVTQEFYITGGKDRTVTFQNVPLNAIVVEKYDSVTGETLAGATFQLRYLGGTSGTGGTVIGQKVTSQNGTAIWTGLEPGTYILEEVDPADGYSIIQSSETVYLADSGEQSVVTVRFENMPDGILLVRKVCSVNPSITLPDAEFKIVYADGTLIGDSNGIYRTDENGEIRIEGLKPGKSVVVTEVAAPPGYIIDTQSQTIQIKEGRTVTLTFKNQPKGELIIQKRDSATGQPLPGAEFRVTTAAGCEVGLDGVIGDSTLTQNGIFTTDSAGEIHITNLAPGVYVISEIRSPSGYVMDAPSTNVVIGEGGDTQTVVITNSKAGSLVIDKRDSLTGDPLEGVTFKVTTSTGEYVPDENGYISSNGIYKTDADGKIQIDGVVGALVVTEVETIPGYTIDPAHQTQTVQVNPNDTQTLYFENTPSTTLVIEKYIEGTTTPLEGVTFLVTDSSGAVVGPSNGEYITDEAGRIVIDDLEPGTTVTAREIKTVEGYVLDGAPKSIEIKAGQVQTLRFYNSKQGTLVIRKLDSVTKEPLSGVEFELTYADGGYVDDANGHLSSKGLYTTDQNGEIRISGVTGTIVVKETKTIEGYTIDEATRIQTVEVNPEDTQTLTFYNDPIGGVEIVKVNADDTKERIPNVTFEIRKIDDELIDTVTTDKNGRVFLSLEDGAYYAVEIEAAEGFQLDGTPHYFEVEDGKTTVLRVENKAFSGIIIHKIDSVTDEGIYDVKFLLYDADKNPIGEYTTDQNGYIYIDEALAEGKGRFYIRELEAAEGYTLDEEYKTVYVQPGKTIEIEWENTPITGQIQIYKYAEEYNPVTGTPAGTPLEGAVFEIVQERSGQVVDYITTDARGVAASKPLPLSRYKIREVTAPTYWQVDPTVHDVTLEYSGQIIKLSAYDKPCNLGVTITKRGNAEVLAGQTMRYDLSVANTSNVPLDSFYLHDKIPYDIARATTLTTGTYSARLNYRILYKTNYTADYQVLASNLLTTNNYSFALNAIPMQAGEVVTDVYFDFGKVPVGFQSVAGPTLSVIVNGTAVGGYQMVNRADAGGNYQGTWQVAQTNWVTIIRKYTPTPTLPKTGY